MDDLKSKASVRTILLGELKKAHGDSARADVLVHSLPAQNEVFDPADWSKHSVTPCLYGNIPETAVSPEKFTKALVDGLTPAGENSRQALTLLRAEFDAALSFLEGKSAASTDDLHLYAPPGPFEKPGATEESADGEACRLLIESLAASLAACASPSRSPPLLVLLGRKDKLNAAALGILGKLLIRAKRKGRFDARVVLFSKQPDLHDFSRLLDPGGALRFRYVRTPPAAKPSSTKPLLADEASTPPPAILRRAGPAVLRGLACSCFLPAPTRDYYELLLGAANGREAFRAVERWSSSGLYGGDKFELTLPPLPAEYLRAELCATDPRLYDQARTREERLRRIHVHVPLPEHRQALIRLSLFLRFTASLLNRIYPQQASRLIRFIESHPEYFSSLRGSYRLKPPFDELFEQTLLWLSPERFREMQVLAAEAWELERDRLQEDLHKLETQAEEIRDKRKSLDDAIRRAGLRFHDNNRNSIRGPSWSGKHSSRRSCSDLARRFLLQAAPVFGVVLLYAGIYLGDPLLFLMVLVGALIFLGGSALPNPKTHASGRAKDKGSHPISSSAGPNIPRSQVLAKIHHQNLIGRNRALRSAERDIASLIVERESLLSEPFIATPKPSENNVRRAHAPVR